VRRVCDRVPGWQKGHTRAFSRRCTKIRTGGEENSGDEQDYDRDPRADRDYTTHLFERSIHLQRAV